LETVEAYDEIERLKLEETSQTKLELATDIIDEQKRIIAQPAMPSVDPKTMMQQELSLASAAQSTRSLADLKKSLLQRHNAIMDKLEEKVNSI
jgi:hypothetical protein